MSTIRTAMPFMLMPGEHAKGVSIAARISNALFGSPNARRANGIVSARFDVFGWMLRVASRMFGRTFDVPVYSIDRVGTPGSESLPRIWLSERVSNTRHDDGRRVFVESYPNGVDFGGKVALELGDRYLGEGASMPQSASPKKRIDCFKAAEILYMHAVRRGSRMAASRLRAIYEKDLCEGDYWATYVEQRARHARTRHARPRRRAQKERRAA